MRSDRRRACRAARSSPSSPASPEAAERSCELARQALQSRLALWRSRETEILVEQPWPSADLGAIPRHSRVWVALRQHPLDALRALARALPLSTAGHAAVLELVAEICRALQGPESLSILSPWEAPPRVLLSSKRGLLRLSLSARFVHEDEADGLPPRVTASAIWTISDLEEGARIAEECRSGKRQLPELPLARERERGSPSTPHILQRGEEPLDAFAHLGGLVHAPGMFGDTQFPVLILEVPNELWAQTERVCWRVGADARVPVDVSPAGTMCSTETAALFCVAVVTRCVDVTCAWLRRAFGGVFGRRVVLVCSTEDMHRVPSESTSCVPQRIWRLVAPAREEPLTEAALWDALFAWALPWLVRGVSSYLETRCALGH